MKDKQSRLCLLASQSFPSYENMYQVIDFLNKSLKHTGLIFGFTKDSDGHLTISIYET